MRANSRNQKKSKNIEKTKWLIILILCIVFFLSNYYSNNLSLVVHILIVCFFNFTIIGMILFTEKGKRGLYFIKKAKNEMKKIIWPQNQETLYTTCIVIAVAIILSLIIWGLDNIIFRLIAFIISWSF